LHIHEVKLYFMPRSSWTDLHQIWHRKSPRSCDNFCNRFSWLSAIFNSKHS